jgi:hypothetical protein
MNNEDGGIVAHSGLPERDLPVSTAELPVLPDVL